MTPDSPVRRQRRFDSPQALEPLPALPRPPGLPGELSPTMPSPSAELPPLAATADGASAAAARRRSADLETRVALAEVRAEKAEAKAATVAPPSDVLSDDFVGKLVKAVVSSLTKRVGGPLALLAMLGVGGAGYKVATDKPAPPSITAADLDARFAKFEDKVGGRLDRLTGTVNEEIDASRCVRKKTSQIGESLLPAPDRMGAKRLPSAFEDDCPDSPKRLPEKTP